MLVEREIERALVSPSAVTRKDVEHEAWENTTAIAWEFLLQHPQHMQQYEFWVEYVRNQQNAWKVSTTSRKPGRSVQPAERLEGQYNQQIAWKVSKVQPAEHLE